MLLSSKKGSPMKALKLCSFFVYALISSGCQLSESSVKHPNTPHIINIIYSVAHDQYEFYLAESPDGMTLDDCTHELLSINGNTNEKMILCVFKSKIMHEELIRIRSHFESYGYHVVCDELSNGDWKYR